jgi:chromosome segregation ATPase
VSGTNGSGKSAVMQGLQACLGVSARSTGRTSRLDKFIRTGADQAMVQVVLCNQGEDAYKPDV